MSDSLFDIYQNVESSKELWGSLEAKYMVEDASSKKFVVSNFTNYKMTDSRTVIEQYNELLGILGRFTQHKMNMDEAIQVSCIIDKLLPFQKDFKHNLKHQKEELTLVELGSHLRIEESLRDDDVAWWVDSRVTVHVCKDRCWFKTYESLNDKSILHMGNESTTLVHGRGCVDLIFSYGKIVSLFNVLHDEALDKLKVFKTKVELQQGSLIKRFKTDRGGRSQGFLGEAMLTACYLLNRIPNKKNMITLYELLTTRKPNPNYLRVWGCRAVVRLSDLKLKTLDERGIECIFVGYADHFKAFRFYIFSVPTLSLKIPNGTEEVVEEVVAQQPESELRKSKRNMTPKDFRPEFQLYLIEGRRDEVFDQHSCCFNDEDDPKTFDEAMKSQDVVFWKEAINDEMDSIMGNNTWVLANLPLGCKPLGFKWIFKTNLTIDGTIKKFKARLVIQGFRKKLGINYFDTYAPVVRISTIRLLIALASIHNLIIHQMDVKPAFLNGELVEEVYMNQPQGIIMPGNENKVCKLIKSLYGLKQAPKKFDKSGKGVIICLYVDDMLIFGTDKVQVDLKKEFLSSRFSMKDMGETDVILGIRIKHESNGIAISQSHYIKKVLNKFNYYDCTPVSTPIDTSEKLMPNNGQAISKLEYSRVIGCLMYAMTYTRPDIAFVVGKLSRYTSNPGTQHWHTIQRSKKDTLMQAGSAILKTVRLPVAGYSCFVLTFFLDGVRWFTRSILIGLVYLESNISIMEA
ncbi:zinc finger, CCHC-type containing protein [Tanacetum coccineum]